jgi:hypothetical protein
MEEQRRSGELLHEIIERRSSEKRKNERNRVWRLKRSGKDELSVDELVSTIAKEPFWPFLHHLQTQNLPKKYPQGIRLQKWQPNL